ncbi:hypothetical protein MMC11_006256 [Xylographa trunciseda]|nr:hypothetical protein [Xylographa trunciseda]
MASLVMATIDHVSEKAEQRSEPEGDDTTKLHGLVDEKALGQTEPSATKPASQDLNQATDVSGPEWSAGRDEWMIIIVLAVVSLMVALDATILVPVLPAIASDLQGDAIDAFWAGTAYLLTQSVCQPFIVSLSDVFGRRTFYLISLGFFTIGSLLCCLSQNFNELLAGRSIQGVGGGGILALGQVILTDIVPLRQRPIYLGVNQIAWALGSICGPLIGGLFVQHTTWRWIFYLNFPFCGIGFLTVPLVMRLQVKRASLKERLLYVDWIGGFLFISSTCSFLIGITWGGTEYPWSSWRTLIPIIIGFAGVVTTMIWERYGARRPFLRLELFNSYSAIAAYMDSILQGLLMFCELYYIPFYLESVKAYSPTITGVSLMPLTISMLPTSVIVGRLMTRFGRFRWAVWLGWLVTLVGTGLLILLDVSIQTYAWVLIFVVVGFGHGLILMSLNFSIQAMADTQNVAYAAAMYTFSRTLGMCIGVAVGGAVFQNQLQTHLGDMNLPTAVATNAEGFLSTLEALPPNSTEYQQYILAYADSFKNVFEVLTALSGLAAILSLFIKEYTMDKELDSEHTLRRALKETSFPEALPQMETAEKTEGISGTQSPAIFTQSTEGLGG